MVRFLLLTAAWCAIGGTASAQVPTIEQGIAFTLKPRTLLMRAPLTPSSAMEASTRRMMGLIASADRVVADDRSHDLQFAVQRQTRRFAGSGNGALPDRRTDTDNSRLFVAPRSRLTRFLIEDHLPIGDHLSATLGWQGIRLSNRNANVTVGAGGDRLRARDWFLPRAGLQLRAVPALALGMDYAETLHGFGDIGIVGPLALRQDDFRGMQRNLRPETHSRLRLTADWTPAAGIDLSFGAWRGRLDDRLSFIDYLPVNSGSARIDGATLSARHQLSSTLRWSLRYDMAHMQVAGGDARREARLAVEGGWTSGPWRGTIIAAHSSTPALAPALAAMTRGYPTRPIRVEVGLDYAATALCRCPLRFAARLTDPDRLASTALGRDDPAGPVRAADQARGLTISALLDL